MKPLTTDQYRSLRRTLGTQTKVGQMLGVGLRTMQAREGGETPISVEMTLAISGVVSRLESEAIQKENTPPKEATFHVTIPLKGPIKLHAKGNCFTGEVLFDEPDNAARLIRVRLDEGRRWLEWVNETETAETKGEK